MSTLDQLEVSVETSRPVELYTFTMGASTWKFTSAEGDVTFNSITYSPIAIKRGSTTQSKEQKSTVLTISLPTLEEVVAQFISIQPSDTLNVTIQRIQPDAVPATTSIMMFQGYVSSVSFKDELAEMRCIPFNELFSRQVPRFQYQGLCNHVLYDSRCKASEGSFKHSGTALTVSGGGTVIEVQALPTSGTPFVGGYLQIPGGSEERLIIAQTSIAVTILYPFKANVAGGTVDAFQGCDHTAVTCAQKFSNILNYGGFPFVPTINPFSKSQLMKE